MRRKKTLSLFLAMVSLFNLFIFSNITASALTDPNGIKYILMNGQATITGFNGDYVALHIYSKIDGYPVAAIADNAFLNNKWIATVDIEPGLTRIGSHAFDGCKKLNSVAIPSSITSMGAYAFAYCNKLERVYLSPGITTISDHAFTACASLRDITIPSSVLSINAYAFAYCSELNKFVIPSSVKTIGAFAFSHCEILGALTISPGVTTLGDGAFTFCPFNSITLPSTITTLGIVPFSGSGLVNINVSPDNQSFSSVDGVLYNKSKTVLIEYPKNKDQPSFAVPSGVTSINAYAFEFCENLNSIILPTSITSIGEGAFAQCKGLGSITIPSGVTAINSHVFFDCTSLSSISIPSSVTMIGGNAFEQYTSLSGITIPSGVTTIGASAFERCTSIKSITIPSGVTTISEGMFSACTSLTSVTLPSVVQKINAKAFSSCTSLKSITLPDGIQTIDNSVFSGCTSLNGIAIPTSVTAIEDYAFNGCTSITGIILPISIAKIGACAFLGCTSLTSISIPINVTTIGDHVFSDCTSLTSVTIPSSVTAIGNFAFHKCTSLAGITIPASVTAIGDSAFSECTSMISITIPINVTSIGNSTFSECNSLKGITIPSSVTAIGKNAFKDSHLLKLYTSLGSYAQNYARINDTTYLLLDAKGGTYDFTFMVQNGQAFIDTYTGNQTNVVIPETIAGYPVTGIGFTGYLRSNGYKNVSSITIPISVKAICDGAFYNCTSLSSIVIPSSVTTIGNCAFQNCTSLTDLIIPSSVTAIGFHAFDNCTGLETITLPPALTIINEGTFQLCKNLKHITIPTGVTNIGVSAFYGCSNLGNIALPVHLTTIGDYAFTDCISFTNITVPAAVTNIGDKAFNGCYSLNLNVYESSYAQSFAARRIPVYTLIDANENSIKYRYFIDNGNAIINAYTGKDTDVVIPTKLGGYPVTTIADEAFKNCTSITSLTIPDGITDVGIGAFFSCTNLTKVTIPASVKNIGIKAFFYCDALSSIEVSPDNQSFTSENGILYDKDQFILMLYPPAKPQTSFAIPSSVTSVSDCALNDCTHLKSVTIPPSVSMVGLVTFQGCTDITFNVFKDSYGLLYIQAKNYKYDLSSDIAIQLCSPSPLAPDTTYQLITNIYNTDNKSLTWQSSNPAVATIDVNGTVTAKENGTTKITATTVDGGKTSTCLVRVATPVTSVSLNPSQKTMQKDEAFTVVPVFNPSNASDKSVSWNSSDTFVATIDSNGLVTAHQPGTTTITAITNDGKKTASFILTVPSTKINVTGISLGTYNQTLSKGQTFNIIATVVPSNTTIKDVLWESLNIAVATVNENGLVTAVENGTADIKATTFDGGKTATCTITVSPSQAPGETSVTLNTTQLTLAKGSSRRLTATVNPKESSNQAVTWRSSNTAVALVNPLGLVTAFAVGTATITATSIEGGKTASCTITVSASTLQPRTLGK